MRKITRSLAIPSLFPKTVESWEAFEKTIRFLEKHRFTQMEFYHPPGHDRDIRRLFESARFSSVMIAVLALKGAGFSLCSPDKEERSRAVSLLKSCMDRAAETGTHSVMVNSGFLPAFDPVLKKVSATAEQIRSPCDAYVSSIEEAAEYGEKQNYNIKLLLEPVNMKSRQRKHWGV